jgi:hypothetical protein
MMTVAIAMVHIKETVSMKMTGMRGFLQPHRGAGDFG